MVAAFPLTAPTYVFSPGLFFFWLCHRYVLRDAHGNYLLFSGHFYLFFSARIPFNTLSYIIYLKTEDASFLRPLSRLIKLFNLHCYSRGYLFVDDSNNMDQYDRSELWIVKMKTVIHMYHCTGIFSRWNSSAR